ncbi:SoxR reducing system RseC family protein, partial [uncultured Porphyromonas sp.]
MKSECIERRATVTAIEGGEVRLTVLRPSACSNCEAAGHCHASESRLETITIDRSQLPSEVAVGDQVSLEMRSSLGMRAVLLTMIIPTILIIAVTILLSYLEVG